MSSRARWLVFFAYVFAGRRNNVQSRDVHTHACEQTEVLINCTGHTLTSVPVNLPAGVKYMDVSHNQIDDVTFELIGLPQLEILDLSFNRIARISNDTFQDKKHLLKIDLSHNLLTFRDVLESGVTQLTSVTVLLIAHNQLGSNILSSTFWSMTALRILDLSFNNISHITETSLNGDDGISDVTELYLQGNRLDRIPTAFLAHLRSLQLLDLSNNAFRAVEQSDFPSLTPHLGTLLLNSNSMLQTVGADAFAGLPGLKNIQISGCRRLSSIGSGALSATNNRTHIYLESNALTTLSEGILPWQRMANNSLHIYNNPITCDCRVAWLAKAGVLRALARPELILCQQPIKLQGQRLIDSQLSQLACQQQNHSSTNDRTKPRQTHVESGANFVGVFGIVAPVGIGLMMCCLVLTVHCKKNRPRPSYELWILKSMSYGSLREQQSLPSESASVKTVPSTVDAD